MEDWVGLTVAEVLALCGARYNDVQLLDDPPGKLRSIRFLCRDAEPSRKVVLEIEYGSGSFSITRSWPQAFVEKLKVVKVYESTDALH
jgi:hypothetical protein